MTKEYKKGNAELYVENLSAIKETEIESLREILAKHGLDLGRPRHFDGSNASTRIQECGQDSCIRLEDSPIDDRTRCVTQACDTQACQSHICSNNSCSTVACSRLTCSRHEKSFASLYAEMSKDSPALIALNAITQDLRTENWGMISLSVE